MLAVLRWMVPALVPAVLFAWLVYRSDKRREPVWLVVTTFALGAVASGIAFAVVRKAMQITGLDVRTSAAGNTGALLFVFALVAPVREAAKVAACWPAFRSRHFDEPYDGVVYASAAAMGFAAVEGVLQLYRHPVGAEWVWRALLAVPGHLFFSCTWGYGLGRARQSKRPGALFPATWTIATAAHGLYIHLVYGRAAGAMLGTLPLLAAMGLVAIFFARDLHLRGERDSRVPVGSIGNRLSRASLSYGAATPSLSAVRDALRRQDQPIMVRWIVFGALVTIGAMVAGLVASVAAAHMMHIDFSMVDEHDITTSGPVAVLGVGILAAFPVSGYLIAKAAHVTSLLEPALATALALAVTLAALGLAAPVALVFALACSPIAWALACMGAWVGR